MFPCAAWKAWFQPLALISSHVRCLKTGLLGPAQPWRGRLDEGFALEAQALHLHGVYRFLHALGFHGQLLGPLGFFDTASSFLGFLCRLLRCSQRSCCGSKLELLHRYPFLQACQSFGAGLLPFLALCFQVHSRLIGSLCPRFLRGSHGKG